MKDAPRTTDGMFVRRPTGSSGERRLIGDVHQPTRRVPQPTPLRQDSNRPRTVEAMPENLPHDEVYSQDDASDHRQKHTRLFGHRHTGGSKLRRRMSRKKKWVLLILLILLVIVIGFGAYFGWKLIANTGKVFQGNIFSALAEEKPLKADKHGRINILAIGTSESDPGHPAAQLTDSIMIVSVDPKKHTAFLVSVPRDFWVKYDKPCSVGYAGKINAVYECALDGASGAGGDEVAAQKAVASKITEVYGVDFAYVVHLNLQVIKQVVDAIGGIDVTIDSPDPRGILDRNFDWRCNYKCYLVKYSNGPAHLDGEHAMWLAQARNDAGGYGLPRSNFDREANQRKILIATKDKATSIGFLANPLNVVNLMDALGNNVHTTVETAEIKSFIKLVQDVPSDKITSIDIMTDAPTILKTGPGPDGSSIVQPSTGLYSYSALGSFMNGLLMGKGEVMKEAAVVDVYNGSDVSGAAKVQADKLEENGITIGKVATAPSATGKVKLYDLSQGKKPATRAELEELLGIKASTEALPSGLASTASFVVVLGKAEETTVSQ